MHRPVVWITRLRHDRGFGLHSPFAYSLVTDWLNPGHTYGMYGDENIDDEGGRLSLGRPHRRRARRLLRLLAALKPRSLWIDSGCSPLMRTAADAAGYRPGCRMCADWRHATMAVVAGDTGALHGAELTRRLMTPGITLLLVGASPGLVATLYDAMPAGLMLRGRDMTLLCHRRGMSKLAYYINL